jgi:hypothetical protein
MPSTKPNKTAKPTAKTVRSEPIRIGGGVITGKLPSPHRTSRRAAVVRTGGGVIVGNLPR